MGDITPRSRHIVNVQKIFFFSPHKYSNTYMESKDFRHLRGKSKIQKGYIFCSAITTLQVLNAFYPDDTIAS